jgi:hypothetical protein
MRTISEDDHMKFLLKARAKKFQLAEDKVDPVTQLEVVDGEATKTKKKRKTEQGCITLLVPPKGSGSGGGVADVVGETLAQASPKKRRTSTQKDKGTTSAVSEKDGGHSETLPLNLASIAVPTSLLGADADFTTSSPWDPLFNLELFLERMVQMTGNSAGFNTTSTDELMKMSLGHELKGLLLNYALASRQREEVLSAHEKMGLVDQNLTKIEKEYAATKDKLNKDIEDMQARDENKVADLTKEHEEKLAKAREDHVAELQKMREAPPLKMNRSLP